MHLAHAPADASGLRAARDRARASLHALGAAAFAHIDGTLERHLLATERLLRRFGSRDAVCLAGLFHAVYGTAGIEGRLVDPLARSAVSDVIGPEAEAIAYLYGACDRDRFHQRIGNDALQHRFVDRFARCEYPIDARSLRDFCELTLANEIELARRNARFRARHRDELAALFERMRGLVSEPGYRMAQHVLRG